MVLYNIMYPFFVTYFNDLFSNCLVHEVRSPKKNIDE